MNRSAARALHAIAALALQAIAALALFACSDDRPASASPAVTTPVPAAGATAGIGGAGAGGVSAAASGAGAGGSAAGSGGKPAPDAGVLDGGAGTAAAPTCRVPDNPPLTDEDADGGIAPDCYDIPRRIFAENCIGGFCHHSMPGPSGGLNLMSPCVADRLLDVRSRCEGIPLIDRAQPERSFLLDKLESEKPRCGASMPDGWHLPPNQVACVNAWVHALVRISR